MVTWCHFFELFQDSSERAVVDPNLRGARPPSREPSEARRPFTKGPGTSRRWFGKAAGGDVLCENSSERWWGVLLVVHRT